METIIRNALEYFRLELQDQWEWSDAEDMVRRVYNLSDEQWSLVVSAYDSAI